MKINLQIINILTITIFFIFSNLVGAIGHSHSTATNEYRYSGPPITAMTDDLLEAIHSRARQLSYFTEENDAFVFQGCVRLLKTNVGSMINLMQIADMTRIANRIIPITNTTDSYTKITFDIRDSNPTSPNTRAADGLDNNLLNVFFLWHLGEKWPRENTIDGRKNIVRYFYHSSVRSGDRTRIESIMDEWESASGDQISFKNLHNSRERCCWLLGCGNPENRDCGKPRIKIIRTGSGIGGSVSRMGAGVGTTQFKYNRDMDPSSTYPENTETVILPKAKYNKTVTYRDVARIGRVWRSTSTTVTRMVTLSTRVAMQKTFERVQTTTDNRFEHVIRHELGHVLGFLHEHQRSDRGNHVGFCGIPNIDTDGNYARFPNSRNHTTYDFESVMGYVSLLESFSISDCTPELNIYKKCSSSLVQCPDHGVTEEFLEIPQKTITKLSTKDREAISDWY